MFYVVAALALVLYNTTDQPTKGILPKPLDRPRDPVTVEQ